MAKGQKNVAGADSSKLPGDKNRNIPERKKSSTGIRSSGKKNVRKVRTSELSPYERLSKPLAKNKGRVQLVLDRLNEVFGIEQWGVHHKPISEKVIKFKGGGQGYDITIAVGVWIGTKENVRIALSGGMGGNHAEVSQAVIAKAFLRSAAMFGAGGEHYRNQDETAEGASESPIVEAKVADRRTTGGGSKELAKELGNPGKRTATPAPHGPADPAQLKEIQAIGKSIGSPAQGIANFIGSSPSYAQAHQVLKTMKAKQQESEMFGRGEML